MFSKYVVQDGNINYHKDAKKANLKSKKNKKVEE